MKNLRTRDHHGEPQLKLVRVTGTKIHWRSGDDGELTRVVQVESVFEAVRAYVAAGILRQQDMQEEVLRLQKTLEPQLKNRQKPSELMLD